MSATSFSTRPDPVSALPSCYRAIFPAGADRRDWLTLKLGWLLAPALTGPVLVFAEHDAARAQLAREDLALAQARVLALIKSGATRDPKRRPKYAEALRQLKRAHRALVMRALGYTWPLATDARGRPAVWVFQ